MANSNKLENIKAAFEWIAIHLKEIKHNDSGKKKFFVYTIEDIVTSGTGPQSVPGQFSLYLEEPDLKHGGENTDNNIHQHWNLSFMILRHCDVTDIAAQEAAKNEALAITYKVMSQFKKWRRDFPYPPEIGTENLWRDLELGTLEITFMNNVWDGRYGVRAAFLLREPLQGQLEYDNDDWI